MTVARPDKLRRRWFFRPLRADGRGGTAPSRPCLERLEGRIAPAAHDTLNTAIPLHFVNQQAQAADAIAGPNQVNLYRLTLGAGDEVTADLSAPATGSLQGCLRVFDGAGRQIAFKESAGGGADTGLTFDVLAGGAYYVGVSSNGDYGYDPNTPNSGSGGLTGGAYDLSLALGSILVAEPLPNLNPKTGDNEPQTIAGSAGDGTISGDAVLQATYVETIDNDGNLSPETYGFSVSDTGGLTATVTPAAGSGFSPKLSLFNAAGQLLIQSDATAADPTARLVQDLQPGIYVLAVSAVADLGQPAGYLLSTRFESALPPSQPLPVGTGPESVAEGDFNHDGNLDLATANYDANNTKDNTVSVLLGNGDGTFQPAVSLSVQSGSSGVGPNYVAVGDLRNDGNLDVVTSNFGDNTVSVLLGNGDGTFQAPTTYPVGSKPEDVALGDFNGRVGIVVANSGDNTVSVLLGNGDGTFPTATTYPVGSKPDAVALGDFNGRVGIVTANQGSNTVSVLLGNGDGTFAPAVSYPVGTAPYDVAVGSFNGQQDIVTADHGSDTVSVLLGDGTGTFRAAVPYAVGYSPAAVRVGNLGGRLAIVSANAFSNSVSVLLGNGDGTFQPATNYPVGQDPFGVVIGDFGGGTGNDIAAANFDDDTVSVLPGRGDGTFLAPVTVATGKRPYAVAVGDFNNDGSPDLATANDGDNTMSVLLGNGDGTFRPEVTYPVDTFPAALAVAKLTADGNEDIVTANVGSDSVSVLRGLGDGTFLPAVSYPVGPAGTDPVAIAVADFNGQMDIVTANKDYDAATNTYGPGSVSVLLGRGDGTFFPAVDYPVGVEPLAIAIGDFDGQLGIVTANTNYDPATGQAGPGTVSVLLGDGKGHFTPDPFSSPGLPPGTFAVGEQPDGVAVGEFNGNVDIATTNSQDDTVSVLLGDGKGAFQPAVSYPVGKGPQSVAVGQFTDGGGPDIVVANDNDSTVSVLLGNGDGTFQPAVSTAVGDAPEGVAVGDFNNDGHLDIATANLGADTVTVLLRGGGGTLTYPVAKDPDAIAAGYDQINNDNVVATASPSIDTVSILVANNPDDTSFHTIAPIPVGPDPVAVAVGNDANGYPDVVTANAGDNTVSVLTGNSTDQFTAPAVAYTVGDSPDAVTVDSDSNCNPVIFTANAGDDTVSVLTQGDSPDGSFLPAENYPVGATPVALAEYEDNNGNAVIVTANGAANTISVLVEDDEGGNETHFDPAVTFPVNDPTAVALGNDSNSNIVIVTASASNNTVSVLRDVNGDDTFQLAGTYAVGNDPVSVQVGTDANNNLDIVTTNFQDNTVSLLRGNPDGTAFQPAVSYKVGAQPVGVDTDSDSQGNLDVFAANAGSSTVSVLLGDLQFRPSTPGSAIAVRNTPFLEPLTGDGIPDQLVLASDGNLLFRRGTGNPADPYAPPVVINPNNPARDATVYRTADGWAVAAIDQRDDMVTLYAWDAARHSFQPTPGFVTGALPVRIAADDLDGRAANGRSVDDLVVANEFGSSVTLAFPDGSGKFTNVFSRPVGADPSDIAFADLGDGNGPAVVVSGQASGDFTVVSNDPDNGYPEARYRAGDGAFDISSDPDTGQQSVLSQLETVGVAAGDFSNSGGDDLITLNQGTRSFTLLPNLGQGLFAVSQSQTTPFPTNAQASQIATLPLPDDASPPQTIPPGVAVLMPSLGQIWVYRNTGGGGFAPPVKVPAGNDPTGFSVTQVGGRLALLVGNPLGDVLTLLYDGGGKFAPDRADFQGAPLAVGTIAATGRQYAVVADQKTDQVWLRTFTPGSHQLGSPVPITGSTQLPVLAPGAVQTFYVPDDPNPYLAVANSLSNSILLYHYEPSAGDFAPVGTFNVGDDPVSITAGRINGDDVPDLAVANEGSNDISVLIGAIDPTTHHWTATSYQRVGSGGSGPVGVSLVQQPGSSHGPDMLATNGNGKVAEVPGIGSGGAGSGFFATPQTLTASLPGLPLGPVSDGLVGTTAGIVRVDPATLATLLVFPAADLSAFSVGAGGDVLAGFDGGAVELLTPEADGQLAADLLFRNADLTDPSALDLDGVGGQTTILVTNVGQGSLYVFTLADGIAVPGTSAPFQPRGEAAEVQAVDGAGLFLVAALVTEVAPGGTTASPAEQGGFGVGVGALSPDALTSVLVAFINGEGGPGDGDQLPPPAPPAPPPGESASPLNDFLFGVDEAIRTFDQPRPQRGDPGAVAPAPPAPPPAPQRGDGDRSSHTPLRGGGRLAPPVRPGETVPDDTTEPGADPSPAAATVAVLPAIRIDLDQVWVAGALGGGLGGVPAPAAAPGDDPAGAPADVRAWPILSPQRVVDAAFAPEAPPWDYGRALMLALMVVGSTATLSDYRLAREPRQRRSLGGALHTPHGPALRNRS